MRINRFTEEAAFILEGGAVAVTDGTPEYTLSLIVADRRSAHMLTGRVSELCFLAVILLGAEKLCIYVSENKKLNLFLSQMTAIYYLQQIRNPQNRVETNKLKGSHAKETDMVTATTAPSATQRVKARKGNNQQGKTVSVSVPQLIDLSQLAKQNGIDPTYAAQDIVSNGGTAGWGGERYWTSPESWEAFVQRYVQGIQQNMSLSPTASIAKTSVDGGNGSVSTEAAKPKTAAKSRTSTPQKASKKGSLRLKRFSPSNAHPKTLKNFLDAQGWDTGKRTNLLEAISKLSEQAPRSIEGDANLDINVLAETCVARICDVYRRNSGKRGDMRPGIIKAAQEIVGGT